MVRPLIMIGCLCGIIYSCRKEPGPGSIPEGPATCNQLTNEINAVKALIPGRYRWVKTLRLYFTHQDTITPQTAGHTEALLLDTSGRAHLYQNSVWQWTQDYRVDYEFTVSTYPLDSATMLIYYDTATHARTSYGYFYVCTDSAYFYNPYSSITDVQFYRRAPLN